VIFDQTDRDRIRDIFRTTQAVPEGIDCTHCRRAEHAQAHLHIETGDSDQILETLPTIMCPYRGEVVEEDTATRPQDEPYIVKREEGDALPRSLRGVKFVPDITSRTRRATTPSR
jgi:hypothetical protein